MFQMNQDQISELENKIFSVLFPEQEEGGGKIMCAIFPSNGVYVASGVVREFNRHGKPIVDMYDYFRKMRMGDYDDLCSALKI